MEDIKLIHGDSLQALKGYADNHFDVAIVDPPYGIKADEVKESFSPSKFGNRHRKGWDRKGWDDDIPPMEYFTELKRVSKNQIIWGGNYFLDYLGNTRCVLAWDKMQEFSGADFEMAWTSFNKSAKSFRMSRVMAYRFIDKIHPTQKPVKLYRWLLENYTNENDLILDTHLGSGSIAIACHYMKRKLIGYEIDKEYYDSACKRFKEQTMQQALW
jgi:site-specific DNA-methyltransferase (adenine-specific)|tara:strand:+ start:123 stop:764 length:642 start_codon:yes stop_codon:yes gene_type:complete